MEKSIFSCLIYISLIGYFCTASSYSLSKSDHILIYRIVVSLWPISLTAPSLYFVNPPGVSTCWVNLDSAALWGKDLISNVTGKQARSNRQVCFTVLWYHSYRYFEHNELGVERVKFVDFPNPFGQTEQTYDNYSISVGNLLKIVGNFLLIHKINSTECKMTEFSCVIVTTFIIIWNDTGRVLRHTCRCFLQSFSAFSLLSPSHIYLTFFSSKLF